MKSLLKFLFSYGVKIAFITMVLSSVACKDNPSFSILPDGKKDKITTQPKVNNKIDVLWVIDNSGSMQSYQNNLTNNFKSFISNFAKKGYDYKIATIGTDAYTADPTLANNLTNAADCIDKNSCYYIGQAWKGVFRDGVDSGQYPGATFSGHSNTFIILPTTPNIEQTFVTNASLGDWGTGDERAFSSIRYAFAPRNLAIKEFTQKTDANGNPFLRSDSFLAIIILSDEDDFSGNSRKVSNYPTTCTDINTQHCYSASTLDTVDSYVTYFDNLTGSTPAKRRYSISNISFQKDANGNYRLPSTNCAGGAGSSYRGRRYEEISNKTGGLTADICAADYSGILNNFQAQISEQSTQMYLDRAPDVTTIKVFISPTCNDVWDPLNQDATNGWTYSESTNSITFHGDALPAQDTCVDVKYTPLAPKS